MQQLVQFAEGAETDGDRLGLLVLGGIAPLHQCLIPATICFDLCLVNNPNWHDCTSATSSKRFPTAFTTKV